MDKKCNRYEALFVFGNESEFQEHVLHCSDCQSEHEKMQKVSRLVKEVAPKYLMQEKSNKISKIASCFMAFIVALVALVAFYGYEPQNYDQSYYQSSPLYSAGLPVDDYGLLKI